METAPRLFNQPPPVAIAAPRDVDRLGSTLRRAYPTPGALPEEIGQLLRQLDR